MITDAVAGWFISLVSAIFGLLPTGDLSSVLVPVDSIAGYLGAFLGGWDQILPLTEALNILAIVVGVVMPAVLAYKIANWTWRHIPDLWGFGPAAG